MATSIEQAFREYSINLEITNRQATLVSERRTSVVTALKQKLTLNSEESKVIGSWDRNTLTRYLSEGDVDVMVILNYGAHKEWDTGDGTIACLGRFKAILDEAYPYTIKRRDQNCITMSFSEFRLDVVPAFKYDFGYYSIPDSVQKRWVLTDPFKFAEKITEANKTLDGRFVPLIKMVKGWNREVGWPIRSFHLECHLYHHVQMMTQPGETYPAMLKTFFGVLPTYLATACFDPVMQERVDGYLDNAATETRRQIAIKKARNAADASKEAYEDQIKYPSVAIGEWKKLLGEFFPSYG